MYGVLQTSDVWMWSNGQVRLQTSIKNLMQYTEFANVLHVLHACIHEQVLQDVKTEQRRR